MGAMFSILEVIAHGPLMLASGHSAPGAWWGWTWTVWSLPGELIILLPVVVALLAKAGEWLTTRFLARRSKRDAGSGALRSANGDVAGGASVAERVAKPGFLRRFQLRFSVWSLLWLMAMVGWVVAATNTGRWESIFIPAFPIAMVATLAACVIVRVRSPALRRVSVTLAALLAYSLLYLRCLPIKPWVTNGDRDAFRVVLSVFNALLDYYQANHHFPPACIRDAAGRPMHSWRVLILPYLGYEDLYKQYRFDEPWDGPNNRRLAKSMPSQYRPWWDDTSTTTWAVAVVGSETVIRDSAGARRKAVLPGESRGDKPGAAGRGGARSEDQLDGAARYFG